MKKILLSFLICGTFFTLQAQSKADQNSTQKSNTVSPVNNTTPESSQLPISVEFKYDKASLQKAKQDNNIVIYFSNIPNGPALEKFAKTIGYYEDSYTMIVGPYKANGERECVVSFRNDKVKFYILHRLLVSNGVNEVTFAGEKMRSADFFEANK